MNIPPGIPDGADITLPSEGAFEPRLGRSRDVVVNIVWKVQHGVRVYGHDIHTTIECSLNDVITGFTKTINVYGDDIQVSRPMYESPSKPIVLKGAGILEGDLVVNISVIWPESLAASGIMFSRSEHS